MKISGVLLRKWYKFQAVFLEIHQFVSLSSLEAQLAIGGDPISYIFAS